MGGDVITANKSLWGPAEWGEEKKVVEGKDGSAPDEEKSGIASTTQIISSDGGRLR